ncbi:MAG: hypothetical protein E7603_10265 [Ruminococcaceae bacterium]|nr:hypothetical protein [Oscillospiraceae bacterium]
MTVTVSHEVYGQIVYNENIWNGKIEITVNGTKLTKIKRTKFIYDNGETKIDVTVKGNALMGAKLIIGDETIPVGKAPAWYEIACSISIFVIVTAWGNNPILCSIFPIVGGGIGGGISGLMAVLNLHAMKSKKRIAVKLGIWLAMLIATFAILFALAIVFLILWA